MNILQYTGHEFDGWYAKFEEKCANNGIGTNTAASVLFFALLEMTKEKDPKSYENIMKALSPDEVRGVVHCGECIYPTERKPDIICPVSCIGLKPYDYCSHGVRMTEVSEDA